MHCRRTLLLALLAATALAASDAANDTATCDSDACRPATKASLYVADRDALAVAATSSASSSGLLLPAIPATRRRSYVPPGEFGTAGTIAPALLNGMLLHWEDKGRESLSDSKDCAKFFFCRCACVHALPLCACPEPAALLAQGLLHSPAYAD